MTTNKIKQKKFSELEEGVDYLYEDGLIVFTAKFLKERGYCCDSGCRNCPYKAVEEKGGS